MSLNRKAPNCWWYSSFVDFRRATSQEILGELTTRAARLGFEVTAQTRASWLSTKEALDLGYDFLTDVDKNSWWIGLEFEIPRVDKRVDCVVLTGRAIVIAEFKTGDTRSQRAAEFQVTDYAISMRNLHSTSVGKPVVPVVVLSDPNTKTSHPERVTGYEEQAWTASLADFGTFLSQVASDLPRETAVIDPLKWVDGHFERTPGILEVIRHVATNHDVLEIRHHRGDHVEEALKNVRSTIADARTKGQHLVCLVDGVPGAGKTFLGLGATQPDSSTPDLTGTYLSGNGPLVKVVSYALEVDHKRQGGRNGVPVRAFVQPVHAFIKSEFHRQAAPSEHVIVFDEAQRAWSADAMSKFHENVISCSEAEAALTIMERHEDWAVIVALIGSGQEIDRGEAGIDAWLNAISTHPKWTAVGPPTLENKFSEHRKRFLVDECLHLEVGIRSPNSLAVTSWIEALLSGEIQTASEIATNQSTFPIFATRSLDSMRSYLKDRARADCRVGLVAPSKDRRLRAFGIERSTPFLRSVNFAHWFVHGADDVRSSYSLEVAASEFDCQGLELDWVGMCWGADFYFEGRWKARKFEGRKWKAEKDPTLATNRYRVLLSRARSGMVIWVPEDRKNQYLEIPTAQLDQTWEILMSAGVKNL